MTATRSLDLIACSIAARRWAHGWTLDFPTASRRLTVSLRGDSSYIDHNIKITSLSRAIFKDSFCQSQSRSTSFSSQPSATGYPVISSVFFQVCAV